MINQDIVGYIKDQLQKNQDKEEIKNALTSAGWQVADIDEAFKYAESGIPLAPIIGNMQNMSQSGQAIQNTQFLAPPTDLLKKAWKIYKARFKTFIGIILVQFMPFIIMLIIGLLYFIPMQFYVGGSGYEITVKIVNLFLVIIAIITMLFLIIVQFWSQSSLFYAIKDSEENIGVKESYRRGWRKIGSIFWVGLLSVIIVLGGFTFFVIPGIIFSI